MATNGRIPVSQMVMRQGLYLWPSTASKFDLMDAWLVSQGYPHMVISQPYGAYRSIADQIKVKAIYGKGAATPGYSNHGLGTAWDIYNIDQYPDAVIAQAGRLFGLVRDAGNGDGGIESWHMHDYNQIVPAGGGETPIDPQEEEMTTLELVKLATDPTVYYSVNRIQRYVVPNTTVLNNYTAYITGQRDISGNKGANPALQTVDSLESFGAIVK